MPSGQTLYDKIWARHTVVAGEGGHTLLHVGRHYIHDGSHAGFRELARMGLKLRRPDRTFGSPDHYLSTKTHRLEDMTPERAKVLRAMHDNARLTGATLFGLDDRRQGIMHVVGPEQGLTQPGMVIVCGDSHTATHGALGALAFGIGASEVAHVMATQTLWQKKSRNLRISVRGRLQDGVYAKDVILAIIGRIGVAGGVGHVIEYAGEAIRSLSMEGRLSLCNMSIEAGARAGMVAPDDTTYEYIAGRPYAPQGRDWEASLAWWKSLPSDEAAQFDTEVELDAAAIEPMVTWGTNPAQVAPISGRIPDPAGLGLPADQRRDLENALQYMGLVPGLALEGLPMNRVFIGSCTNSRIEDLREAACVAAGRKAVIPALVVPGSGLVKAQAEAEGLDKVFLDAGFEWRLPGCSMCVGMNGDTVAPGEHCASTSNRNFVGRQGTGARTHLVSPAMAAAAAVTGRLTDVRKLRGTRTQGAAS
jgi:3-isopropylmalate/(R)-2-methylmalate dehydratase large subunit